MISEHDLEETLNAGAKALVRRDPDIVESLCGTLRRARRAAGPAWRERLTPICLAHSLQRLLCEDPYTGRAFTKPRGYAGDAVMLDYVYDQRPPAETSELGAWVFWQTTASSSGASVRERRRLLADSIDRRASTRPGARVLSIGAGHMRETEMSEAVRTGALAEVVAIDQDPESLAIVDREQGAWGVRTRQLSVKCLATSNQGLKDFDFVYSAGVFDYLPDLLASRLLAAMYSMLREGGSLLVGNFVPESHGVGYMEAFMDWHLVYRDTHALRTLAAAAGLPGGADVRTFRDAQGNVAYLEIAHANA